MIYYQAYKNDIIISESCFDSWRLNINSINFIKGELVMNKFPVLQTMHNGTREISCISTSSIDYHVQSQGAIGKNLSPKRPHSFSARSKLNYGIVALEYLSNHKISFFEFENEKGIYAEVFSSENATTPDFSVWFKRDSKCCYSDMQDVNRSTHCIIPIFLYALSHLSGMSDTQDAFKKCFTTFITTGSFNEDEVFYLSDCFYYDCKDDFGPSGEISWNDGLNADIIKQSIRTGQLNQASILEAFFDFNHKPSIIDISYTNNADNETDNTDIYNRCINGDFQLDYVWEKEQLKYIKSLDYLKTYEPCDEFFDITQLVHHNLSKVLDRMNNGLSSSSAIGNDYVNCILVGKPGTGKTTLANALSAAFNMPIRVVAASKNTEEDEFEGKTKVVDGGFKFVETKFLDAYKRGGILLLEEFNLADPGMMMGAIGQAIEKPFFIDEDGYKEVGRHPLCVIIATMNTATQGSREANEAFTSRLPNVYLLADPEEDLFINILHGQGYDIKLCRKVYKVYSRIISFLSSSEENAEDVAMSITIRHCLAALDQMESGSSFKRAVKHSMVDSIAIKDISLALRVYRSVVEPMA